MALAAALVALALAPAVASVSLAAHSESAFDTPFESAKVQETIGLGAGQRASLADRGPLLAELRDGTRYLMAAQSVGLPSLIIYDTGQEALPIGGLDGTTPSPTLAQLQADIRHGLLHLVWMLSGTDPRLRWVTTHCSQVTKRLYNCVPPNAGRPLSHLAPTRSAPHSRWLLCEIAAAAGSAPAAAAWSSSWRGRALPHQHDIALRTMSD